MTGKPLSLGGFVLAVLALLALAAALPFLAGLENVIGLLIIGIALYEAWKINKKGALVVSGPYRVGESHPAPEVSAG